MRAADRRKLILEAAGELFIAKGYSGVSMEDVLARVGGSKATLYRHFADKAALFQASVEALCDEWSKPVHSFRPPDADLAATLTALGGHFADLVLTPQAIALHRLVTAESERMPEVGRAFFEHGPATGQGILAGYLRQAHEAGEISVTDPLRAAAQLYQAMLGDAQMRLLTNSPHKPDDAEVRESIALAVRVFLHGAATRPAVTK
ncbi:TetR/AcrR family transcriptional regulator [Streptomyces cylindrosporus]|uniref:TetR/AcrR family transcriptional regulator n=1 Tax=Streptomyces cylindrosporus TaxID=2927583 RepID=A0ABS9YDL3_9ACTN|nr:TetR/AcrR family transcriptional regulator [Streptomyces cylindrosporus]MCI3275316.1 TetR/AcrR family transcriptional regulator [Streptomyces cylindrosporus]